MQSLLHPLNLNWALNAALPPLDFVLPGLLPGTFGLVVAPGATGKSYLALDIAIAVTLGRAVAGGLFPAGLPGKVVYLAAEESDRILAERLRPMLEPAEREHPLLMQNLKILPMAGEPCRLLSDGRLTPLYTELVELCEGARLVIVDPVRRLHDGDENASGDMSNFVYAMERLAQQSGAAVIGLHHANRGAGSEGASQNASRGSSALVDGARWLLNLARMDDKTAAGYDLSEQERQRYVAVDLPKTNNLPPRARCWLRRDVNGALRLAQPGMSSRTSRATTSGARTL